MDSFGKLIVLLIVESEFVSTLFGLQANRHHYQLHLLHLNTLPQMDSL